MIARTTISPGYLALQRELHKDPNYGTAALDYAKNVMEVMERMGARSLSDYGAGKKKLYMALRVHGLKGYEYLPYDPAFPEYGPPKSADVVCCIDVLEHIEPEHLDAVLIELKTITTKIGFFTVQTQPAMKVLADGRNAHLIQEPVAWWLAKLGEYFDVVEVRQRGHGGFWVVVKPSQVT
jgi:hypothetical protein